MIYRLCVFLTSIFCLIQLPLFSEEPIIDKATGELFPRKIQFMFEGKNYDLETTGVATRKRLIVKVYSIAHYLQIGAKGDKMEATLSDENAKQLTLKWVYGSSPEKIHEAFQDGFHRVFSSEQYLALQKEIDRFLSLFNQATKPGDQFILRWIPGGHLVVIINGKEMGTFKNSDLALGVWKIWFGKNSIVNVNDLLSH